MSRTDDTPRIEIFVDGMNFYIGQGSAGVRMRIESMGREIARQIGGDLTRLRYYTSPMPGDDPEKQDAQDRFFRALSYAPGVDLILGRHDARTDADGNIYHAEKETDVRLAIDMALGAAKDRYDIAVVVAGDTDYVPAIEAAKAEGKRVVWAHFPHQRGIVRLYSAAGEDLEFTRAFCEACAFEPWNHDAAAPTRREPPKPIVPRP